MAHPEPGLNNDHQKKVLAVAVTLAGAALAFHSTQHLFFKQPLHNSTLCGLSWVNELLNGHESRIQQQFGMRKHVFCKLVRVLQEKTTIAHTKFITTEEQTAIFLYAVVTNLSNRQLAERFQRSTSTISRYAIFTVDQQLTLNQSQLPSSCT
jgi:hypothetical protein